MRERATIIEEIKKLVASEGYIYALCMILFEDFHIDPEKLHEIDYYKRLSIEEASLLLGFLVQKKIQFTKPSVPQDVMKLKKKTYELMEELHQSFIDPFIEKLQTDIDKEHSEENFRIDMKDFFGKGDMLIEAMFYSGPGVYDIQYSDFLERKYKYDQKWLGIEKGFSIHEVQNIVKKIKSILYKKSKKVHLCGLQESLPKRIEEQKKEYPDEDWEEQSKIMIPAIELYQYRELSPDYMKFEGFVVTDEDRKKSRDCLYDGIIELFVIRKSDFPKEFDIENFLNKFSIIQKDGLNSNFKDIGNYNIINSNPIIKLDEERYFVPMSFLVYRAIYENPFYRMINDEKYKDQAGENRGKIGEEISYDFLVKIFGRENTFKSVKILSPKTDKSTVREDETTDVDVLCLLGSKALCVQVKSKKLTELSRTGNDDQLQKDFKGAVQDAYEQGLTSRQSILRRNSRFINEFGGEIKLSEEIDEVYIMVITTENYPSLTHQSYIMLEKNKNNPFPIVMNIFDLELITFYLTNPYDFLYYIRQRIVLMDYFKANEEMDFLGYHLDQKLWKFPNVSGVMIPPGFGSMLDRNYYPQIMGLNVSDDGDAIKNRWKNANFDELCNGISTLKQPKVTDIIFNLLDWSGEAREDLVNFIISTKKQTGKDNKSHNFSIPPNDNEPHRLGITYISSNSDDTENLKKKLLMLCSLRKYKSKGDIWIGFGSLKNSTNMVDYIFFNDTVWQYDKNLEGMSDSILKGKGHGREIRLRKKIGRNEKCSCGSGLKYKKCCGKPL